MSRVFSSNISYCCPSCPIPSRNKIHGIQAASILLGELNYGACGIGYSSNHAGVDCLDPGVGISLYFNGPSH